MEVVEVYLVSYHPLISFEMQMYYQNEFQFNSVYSRNYLSTIKHEVYVINPQNMLLLIIFVKMIK